MHTLLDICNHLQEEARGLSCAHALQSSEGADCLEIDIDGTDFLLTRTPSWCEGLALIAELGCLAAQADPLLHEAMSDNLDRALSHRPVFSIDRQEHGAVLTAVQRIPFIDLHTPTLVESLLEVAALRRRWHENGWLLQPTSGETT